MHAKRWRDTCIVGIVVLTADAVDALEPPSSTSGMRRRPPLGRVRSPGAEAKGRPGSTLVGSDIHDRDRATALLSASAKERHGSPPAAIKRKFEGCRVLASAGIDGRPGRVYRAPVGAFRFRLPSVDWFGGNEAKMLTLRLGDVGAI